MTAPGATSPEIPAAQWSDEDGKRCLVAGSNAAEADLEPIEPSRSHPGEWAFVFLTQGRESMGGYITPDGARALCAVLHRWLAEQAVCWMCQGTRRYVPASDPGAEPVACPACKGGAL